MKQRVTISDIAAAASVSKQTVSRALNSKGEIKADTRDRILKIADDMGYRPNRLARAMSTNRTMMIGMVIPDITNPFFPEVARGVHDVAFEKHYNVLLCNTDDESRQEMDTLELLASQGVDGIINFSHKADEEELLAFAESYRPIILVNREITHPHIDTLIVNNYHGTALAIECFVAKGHKTIGMLTNERLSLSLTTRVQGYFETLDKHKLENNHRLIETGDANLSGGYDAAKRLIARRPDITAIFAYNDVMGLGAIRACLDAGKRVPDDIAIIGFDDIQLAAMNNPSLSSVHVDKYALGREAFGRLHKRIVDPNCDLPPPSVNMSLVLRESTKP